VIAAKGSPEVLSEITINPSGIPILLKAGALVRDRLELDEQISYQVYSATTFNISLSVLYGTVEISVVGPNNNSISKMTTSSV
jgi:hypothetical protein